MKRIDTIIIGAGQAGLAVSRSLFDRGIEHVILERGRVAQRWTERWDSLRLLSPNWMTRLPGYRYQGDRPDDYMSRDEVTGFLTDYARSFDAPVEEETEVRRVYEAAGGWRVETDSATWSARNVVIATGHSQKTRIPSCAEALAPHIAQIASSDYRNPSQLPYGGVLVVGSSASGVQLADEILRSGREVTLATGRHTRLPRRYRGRDIMYWLDRIGSLQRPLTDMPDPVAAQREPSLQLVGDDPARNLDLSMLASAGVRVTGRLVGLESTRARFRRDYAQNAAAADHQMTRLLERIDRHIESHALGASLPPADTWNLTTPQDVPDELDLDRAGIRAVLWTTGYRRSYEWLEADVFDERGEVKNQRGRTKAPGLFIIGLQFMVRRNSSFIDGVGRDAVEIATTIATRGDSPAKEAA